MCEIEVCVIMKYMEYRHGWMMCNVSINIESYSEIGFICHRGANDVCNASVNIVMQYKISL